MTTQWTRWLVVASAMAALSLGFVGQINADDFLKAKKGYGPLPEEARAPSKVVAEEREEPVVNAREITFTASSNPYRYRGSSRYRYGRYYRPVIVTPYYYGYNPYGGYSPYNVPSVGWPALPAPFSYDTFHPGLGY